MKLFAFDDWGPSETRCFAGLPTEVRVWTTGFLVLGACLMLCYRSASGRFHALSWRDLFGRNDSISFGPRLFKATWSFVFKGTQREVKGTVVRWPLASLRPTVMHGGGLVLDATCC